METETEYSGVVSGRTACIHVFTAWTSVNSSTHTRTCTKCGEVETASHTLGSWSTTSSNHSASCTANCGYSVSGSHSWSGWTTTTPATCTSAGSRRRSCTVCGYSQSQTINATGHAYNITSSTSATCTSGGTTTYRCSECGYSYTDTTSALGHNYTYSWSSITQHLKKCTRCSYAVLENHYGPLIKCDGCGVAYQ